MSLHLVGAEKDRKRYFLPNALESVLLTPFGFLTLTVVR